MSITRGLCVITGKVLRSASASTDVASLPVGFAVNSSGYLTYTTQNTCLVCMGYSDVSGGYGDAYYVLLGGHRVGGFFDMSTALNYHAPTLIQCKAGVTFVIQLFKIATMLRPQVYNDYAATVPFCHRDLILSGSNLVARTSKSQSPAVSDMDNLTPRTWAQIKTISNKIGYRAVFRVVEYELECSTISVQTRCRVRFFLHHGESDCIKDTYVYSGDTITAPTPTADQSPTGWTFVGWKGWSSDLQITEDTDFYGSWEVEFTAQWDDFPGDSGRNWGQLPIQPDGSKNKQLGGGTNYNLYIPKGALFGIANISGEVAHIGGCVQPDDPTSDTLTHLIKMVFEVGQLQGSGYTYESSDTLTVVPEHRSDGTPWTYGSNTYIKYPISISDIEQIVTVTGAPNPASTSTWSKSLIRLTVQKMTPEDGYGAESCNNYWAIFPITIKFSLG